MTGAPKHIKPLDWSKKDLYDSWQEERSLKARILAERDTFEAQLHAERRKAQSLAAKLADANVRTIKEQGRADSVEAALLRAHKALVTAVERLGGR